MDGRGTGLFDDDGVAKCQEALACTASWHLFLGRAVVAVAIIITIASAPRVC